MISSFIKSASLKRRLILLIMVAVFSASFAGWYFCLGNRPAGDGRLVRGITVSKGASFAAVAEELGAAGLIRSSLHLRITARLHGLDRRMQAGDYRISDAMLPMAILEKMANGQTDACRFILPEGYSMFQAAELLERQGIFEKQQFLAACSNRRLLAELGINADTAEGYLFPGTYQIGFNMDEEDLVKTMAREFRRRTESLAAMIESSGMTERQCIVLASIVEREAVTGSEKPMIASVFLNRLKISMPLQSDPTAIYGQKVFGGTVTGQDVRRDSPYNTYKIKGLPPGPIGNPGIDSMMAVLKPAKSDFLYFVSRKDGTHQFSRTLSEHNQAVNTFLRKKNKSD